MIRPLTAAALMSLLAFVPAAAQVDEAKIGRGKQAYEELRCQTCHAIDGAGNRRYPLDGVGSKLTEEQIRKWIVAPREMNPKVRKRAYDNLAPERLDALVAYLASLKNPAP